MTYRQSATAALSDRRFPALQRRFQQTVPSGPRAILDGLRWGRRLADEPTVTTIAEVAECGCPDWCHRDHDND